MKVVIIGSGIAGMALAVILRNNGFEIAINERDSEMPRKGHAFLMHPDAMDILNDISTFNPGIEIPGQVIDKIVLKSVISFEISYHSAKGVKSIDTNNLL